MKYFCIELNKEFDSQGEMFKALKKSESKIISLKKASVYKSIDKGQFTILSNTPKMRESIKGVLDMKEDFIYPVINTTKYMDSHRDVHFDGLWKKTLKEQQGNIFYVSDHSLKVADVIAWPGDVKAFTENLKWSALGADYDGETQALIYEIPKSKIAHEKALDVVENKRPVQNSIRMQYVKIQFAVNSDDKDYADNKVLFDSHIDEIANKDEANDLGYFWIISEAKIYKEGSMVLLGSNDITPILQLTDEPEKSTLQNNEPEKSTQNKIKEIRNFKFY